MEVSCYKGWVSEWAYLWELPCTGLSQTFRFLFAKQYPGFIWRLERDWTSWFDFEKILTAFKRAYITAHKLLNQYVHNNASYSYWYNGRCFQFLLKDMASHTEVSQWVSLISWGTRFASHKVEPYFSFQPLGQVLLSISPLTHSHSLIILLLLDENSRRKSEQLS